MEPRLFKFDFHATVEAVGHALLAVICHILFDFAMVGIGVACVLAVCGFVMGQRKHRFEKPLYSVAKRVSLACAAISVPGVACLLLTGSFPESGVYVNFSLGFLVLWSMVVIYLCAEEMNHTWFDRGQSPAELEIEPEDNQVVTSSGTVTGSSQVQSASTSSKITESGSSDENDEKETVDSREHQTASL